MTQVLFRRLNLAQAGEHTMGVRKAWVNFQGFQLRFPCSEPQRGNGRTCKSGNRFCRFSGHQQIDQDILQVSEGLGAGGGGGHRYSAPFRGQLNESRTAFLQAFVQAHTKYEKSRKEEKRSPPDQSDVDMMDSQGSFQTGEKRKRTT